MIDDRITKVNIQSRPRAQSSIGGSVLQRARAARINKDHPVRWERQTRVAPRPPPPGSEYSDYQYYMRAREKAI